MNTYCIYKICDISSLVVPKETHSASKTLIETCNASERPPTLTLTCPQNDFEINFKTEIFRLKKNVLKLLYELICELNIRFKIKRYT